MRELLGGLHRDGEAAGGVPLVVEQPQIGRRHGGQGAGHEAPLPVEAQVGVFGAGLARQVVEPALNCAVAGKPPRRQAADPRRFAEPHRRPRSRAPAGSAARPSPPRELGVGLAALRPHDQPEQDHRHRDHRNQHDDHEEEPETAPEARGAQLKRAHRGCTANRSLHATSWQLQSLVHGAGRKPCLPGAIAQLGERLDRTQEVGGSSPPSSTSRAPYLLDRMSLARHVNRRVRAPTRSAGTGLPARQPVVLLPQAGPST